MEKRNKIIFWILTGLISALMLMSASMYLLKTDEIKLVFNGFGYPSYLVYPLAFAKILGVVAIVSRKSKTLTEWAYVGFFFDLVLAFFAHYMIEDGGHFFPLIGIVILLGSYVMSKKVFLIK
jgi:uncharacterized membrane protein